MCSQLNVEDNDDDKENGKKGLQPDIIRFQIQRTQVN